MSAATLPFLRVSGDPFEVGYQHGQMRAAALREFLDDDLARINKLTARTTLAELSPVLAEYSAAIAAATPALSEEIAGLAQGADLAAAEAVLLQTRRELIGFQKIPARGDCTTYASLSAGPGGTPVLAQTVDLNGDLDDQIAMLDIELSGPGRRRALVLSFGGLLGYLGINSDGLAIGLNLVLGGTWRPGLPPYLAIRHLLDTATSVDHALDILPTLPLASSRSLTLCDQSSVACVEILDNQIRLTTEPDAAESTHTNHFLHPDFISADELNVFARNSSLQRLKACRAGLIGFAESATGVGVGVEEHFALLAQPGVCVADTKDIRRERTVAAVVMLPARGELHVRPGDPAHASTVRHGIQP